MRFKNPQVTSFLPSAGGICGKVMFLHVSVIWGGGVFCLFPECITGHMTGGVSLFSDCITGHITREGWVSGRGRGGGWGCGCLVRGGLVSDQRGCLVRGMGGCLVSEGVPRSIRILLECILVFPYVYIFPCDAMQVWMT